ncbi:MAG: PTPA-CTERM sorting domain-containing protein, partial [Leptolyngbyaceae cyanobacterium SL_7_1]|nr:PTPA-CTERM sorting domain-containing protein [Leptolyngbyaceae cyanobacterium SL_7_1]
NKNKDKPKEEKDKPKDKGNETPIPTPALLPGLIGLGVSAYRKHKARAPKA